MSKTSLILSTSLYDDHKGILKVSAGKAKNVIKDIFILCASALNYFRHKKGSSHQSESKIVSKPAMIHFLPTQANM